MKRTIYFIFMLVLVCALCACDKTEENYDTISAAVMVGDTGTYNASYNQLKNSMLATMEVKLIGAGESNDYSLYDLIYIDKSAAGFIDADSIEEYVKNGGYVFLDNSLYDNFSLAFLGAQDFERINGCPIELDYPECDSDIKRLQELIYDFSALYADYKNYDTLSQMDYGYAMLPSTAQTLAERDGYAVYALNRYGAGYVLFTNPLLPNELSVNDLTTSSEGEYLASTTVGANILMRSYFAEFVSLKKYGYAVERTFGSFGSKPAAWELHYEDITGIENKSAIVFDELCRKYGQFPSFTLARNPYTWFERCESVTYALSDSGSYAMDPYENAYSSGTHIVSAGEWLSLDSYDNTESYFKENTEYVKRACPYICDFNNDGKADIICGSADGYIYFFEGYGMRDNYETGAAVHLTDTNGIPLNVGGYSSPIFADIDNDGIMELLSGSDDGNIYAFKQYTGMAFEEMGSLIDTGVCDPMPYAADINDDGIIDLIVGSRENSMRIYYGEYNGSDISFEEYAEFDAIEARCAPCAADLDNDGVMEIYVGTKQGYIMRFLRRDGDYAYDGYIEGNENNCFGNTHLKFGENCVPRFYDINGDGELDLIAGSLEYGMAYPIDSPYFPLKECLKEQIAYCRENNIYIGAHVFTHEHADAFHEQRELEYQKKAFSDYGIDWDCIGANQHTWYTSSVGYDAHYDNPTGYDGTYRNEFETGLLWNNGSQPPASKAVPQISAENSINIPFYLFAKGAYGMLFLETSNTPHGNGVYSYTSAKYEVPMLFYDHCDYIYDDPNDQEAQIKKADQFVKDFGYTFVSERQMAKAAAAAFNTRVQAKNEDGIITLKAVTIDDKIPLYDKNYAQCVGVRVILQDDASKYSSSANVWRRDNDSIYLSLDNDAKIFRGIMKDSRGLVSVNSPAKVKNSGDNIIVEFKEGGIMQVIADGYLKTDSEGWQTRQYLDKTIYTKYGEKSSLELVR